VRRPPGLWTVPNGLSAVRLVLSPVLVVLAWEGAADWCLGLFIGLWVTDWLDGTLAKRLKQETAFGARLDSLADAAFYGAAVLAVCLLDWPLIRREAIWIGAAAASYAVTTAAGLLRFGRVPSYHTRLAKTSWLLVGVAVISVLAGWSVWPLRVALAAVVVTNLEATAITLILSEWRVNVPSVYHAVRLTRERPPATPGDNPTS
jgi:CDP-diacylglycerol--glycerol-3-phosphate 3-phosphatidyltransferase